jgi:hypothetical protein
MGSHDRKPSLPQLIHLFLPNLPFPIPFPVPFLDRKGIHCTALYIHGWYATIMLNMIHQVVLNYTWAGVVLKPSLPQLIHLFLPNLPFPIPFPVPFLDRKGISHTLGDPLPIEKGNGKGNGKGKIGQK